jgi:hypothetical protein
LTAAPGIEGESEMSSAFNRSERYSGPPALIRPIHFVKGLALLVIIFLAIAQVYRWEMQYREQQAHIWSEPVEYDY